MAPNGRELGELLSPHTVPEFVTEYWERQPLYIPGPKTKFDHLGLDLQALERVIRARTRSGRLVVRFVGPDDKLKPTPRALGHFSVRDGDLTVCADWISDCFEELASYCAGIKAGLSLPGGVFMTCYASPDGHGFGTHFDCNPSFILQLEGTKVWRFSARPAVEWPPANVPNAAIVPEMLERYPWLQVQYPDAAVEAEFREQELTPGDVLFLPPGTWHRARAIDYSVALTMTCTPMTAADFFADLLRGQLSRAAEWRQGAPPVPVDAVPPAELPPVIERFFAARLSELQQHVQSLRANDLYEIWTHYVHSYATPFPLLAADPSMEVKETDTLVLVRELPLQYLVSPDRDAVTLYFFDHRLDLSYAAMPLVQAMITHTSFPARQAGLWLGETFAWPDVKALLQELVRAGILQVLSEHQ